ncbi:hypothetical protein BJ170DRAFT_96420 [Xylariales sp. AK1849]|nr:hypothetical protein BJ170DRAFT_96420 [Xylariales sp. AK1849]
MPSKKRPRQTRLTFEPAGEASSPDQRFSPAKVRYSESAPMRSSPLLPKTTTRSSGPKKSQKTLENSLGKMKTRRGSQASPPSSRPPPASFMPKSQTSMGARAFATDSSDEEGPAAEGGVERGDESDDDDDDLPVITAPPMPTSSQSVSTRLKRTVISDDDEDDLPIAPSSSRRRKPEVVELDDDDEDLPIAPSSSRRRRVEAVELYSSSDSDVSPTKKRKTRHQTASSSSGRPSKTTSTQPTSKRLTRKGQPPSSPTKRVKGHRTEKQKTMELLKRRRAGEKIDKLTSSESESGDDKRGLYDSDSDNGLEVLKEFSDEEEDEEVEEVEAPPRRTPKRSAQEKPPQPRFQEDGSEDDLDDFVVEDDDGPIGAPANLDIPLEFTAQAHKPLKEQFPYVVEWLVHNRVNPAFERNDPVYRNAWDKLGLEVAGLASSKFVSSVWKAEFYRTLKARPNMEAYEMNRMGDADLYATCEACGRSGHPATWTVRFEGHPYHKDTLAEIESDSEDSSDSDASHHSHATLDSQDNALPPTSKEWIVGSVCCSNAETAHSLLHWKHALKEWVEERLEHEGHMTAAKLKERDRMKAKKRREAANAIVDQWEREGNIGSLYGDFKATLQSARDKSTTGRRGQRWR